MFRPPLSAVRMLILPLAVAFAIPALVGCRNTQSAEKAVLAPVGSLVQSWKLPLELSSQGDSIRGLYLRDDILFAYSQNNRVVAITAATGKIIFGADVTPGSIPLKPPIVMKDRYCFPDGSSIECYDRKTGKLLDSVETERSIRSPGAQSGNTIYVGLDYPGGGRLSAIDLTRKYDRARWQALTFGGIASKPAVFQNVVYFGSEDGRVYAVGEDRTPVWPLEHSAFQTDGKVIGDLYADETGLYVASTDAKLYCLELGTGKIKWQYFAAAPLEDGPVVTDDTVYVTVPRVGVAVLTKTEGKYNREPRFVAKGADRFLAQDEKNVYLKSTDNYIVAYDKQSGEMKFKSERRDLIALAVNTTKDSTIYGATRDGLVLAIKPVNKPGTVGTLVAAPVRAKDAG